MQTEGDDEMLLSLKMGRGVVCQIQTFPSQSLFDFVQFLCNKLGSLPMEKRYGLNMYEFQEKDGVRQWWLNWRATSTTHL